MESDILQAWLAEHPELAEPPFRELPMTLATDVPPEANVPGTRWTMHELSEASHAGGHDIFFALDWGDDDHARAVSEYQLVKLSDLVRPNGNVDPILVSVLGDRADPGLDHDSASYVDDHEYIFFPSTGKGLDASDAWWGDADQSWVDQDGNIYSYWAGDHSIRVVTVDIPLSPA